MKLVLVFALLKKKPITPCEQNIWYDVCIFLPPIRSKKLATVFASTTPLQLPQSPNTTSSINAAGSHLQGILRLLSYSFCAPDTSFLHKNLCEFQQCRPWKDLVLFFHFMLFIPLQLFLFWYTLGFQIHVLVFGPENSWWR